MPELARIAEEKIAFSVILGDAVTAWGNVEWALFRAGSCAFDAASEAAAQAGYLSIENFRSKLAFVDKAIGKIGLNAELVAEWATVRDDRRAKSSVRNRMVHYRMFVFLDGKPGRRIALVPPGAQLRGSGGKPIIPQGSLCIKDIDVAQQQFHRVVGRLLGWHARARGLPDYFGEPAQRDIQPRTLAQIEHQIREQLGPSE